VNLVKVYVVENYGVPRKTISRCHCERENGVPMCNSVGEKLTSLLARFCRTQE
jgi:hypothetical protein